MNDEDMKELKSILEASHVVTEKPTIFFLAQTILPPVHFNLFRETYLNADFNVRMAIRKLVEVWRSVKGKEATLRNFSKILREAYFNHEAGKCLPIGSISSLLLHSFKFCLLNLDKILNIGKKQMSTTTVDQIGASKCASTSKAVKSLRNASRVRSGIKTNFV